MPATKTKKPPKPVAEPVAPVGEVQPVRVDGTNRRSDDDALEGGFCTIVKGEYEGRLASFLYPTEYGDDGYPTEILVRTRDADSLLLTVPYADVRPAATNGGR